MTTRTNLRAQLADTNAKRVGEAVSDLFTKECAWSCGYFVAFLFGCVFSPVILKYWFINGVLDFSTALVIGSVSTQSGMLVRALAYVLIVPAFFVAKFTYYAVHPQYRQTILTGACPTGRLFSLDWFSVGILATGLPLALQDLGPWIGMNTVFLLGVFVLPRFVHSQRLAIATKIASLLGGTILFLYANYGVFLTGFVPWIPDPTAVLGPVATFQLTDTTTTSLLRAVNSVVLGPPIIAVFAYVMNRLLTHEALTSIPAVHHTLPRRDPWKTVTLSAAIGTLVYLGTVFLYTGEIVIVPWSPEMSKKL